MASGDTLATFHPYQNEPPASAFATIDLRNAHPVLDFDAATDESAVFTAVMPRHYGGGGVTVKIIWAATSATSGDVRWQTAFERVIDQDIDADGFATAQSGFGTANATSGIPTQSNIAHTDGAQIDSIGIGDVFRLKVTRDADGTSGTDDLVGDAEFLMAEVRET